MEGDEARRSRVTELKSAQTKLDCFGLAWRRPVRLADSQKGKHEAFAKSLHSSARHPNARQYRITHQITQTRN